MPLSTGSQLRAARALLRLDKESLADAAGISSNTLRKLESVDGPLDARTSTIRALEAVFTKGGVEFTDGDAPGVRLRKPTPTAA